MTIRICKPAPDVPVGVYVRGDPDAKRLTLADYRGRWVVLAFYPRDFTPVCRTELQRLAELEPAFEDEQAAVLAASTDSVHSHRAWIEGDPHLAGVRYPVLADTSHKLARAFGVLTAGGAALHATFILDPTGVVRHLLVNDAGVGRSVEETLRTLQALRTGQPCPAGWHPGQCTLSGAWAAAPVDRVAVNA
jgi:peroxiredoxin (alkyl hydroperoxide reductase subunit C)